MTPSELVKKNSNFRLDESKVCWWMKKKEAILVAAADWHKKLLKIGPRTKNKKQWIVSWMLRSENMLLLHSLNVTNWNIIQCRETKMNWKKLTVKNYRNCIQQFKKDWFKQEAQVPLTTINRFTSNLFKYYVDQSPLPFINEVKTTCNIPKKDRKVWVNQPTSDAAKCFYRVATQFWILNSRSFAGFQVIFEGFSKFVWHFSRFFLKVWTQQNSFS